MGSIVSSFSKRFSFTKKDVRVLLIGLDNAGKTTALYQLIRGEDVMPFPGLGIDEIYRDMSVKFDSYSLDESLNANLIHWSGAFSEISSRVQR